MATWFNKGKEAPAKKAAEPENKKVLTALPSFPKDTILRHILSLRRTTQYIPVLKALIKTQTDVDILCLSYYVLGYVYFSQVSEPDVYRKTELKEREAEDKLLSLAEKHWNDSVKCGENSGFKAYSVYRIG